MATAPRLVLPADLAPGLTWSTPDVFVLCTATNSASGGDTAYHARDISYAAGSETVAGARGDELRITGDGLERNGIECGRDFLPEGDWASGVGKLRDEPEPGGPRRPAEGLLLMNCLQPIQSGSRPREALTGF